MTILADHHSSVCRQLAGPVEDRFTGITTSETEDGALILDEGLAHFDTTIYREVEAGDHTIILLELHAIAHAEVADGLPLVFHRSKFGLAAS